MVQKRVSKRIIKYMIDFCVCYLYAIAFMIPILNVGLVRTIQDYNVTIKVEK